MIYLATASGPNPRVTPQSQHRRPVDHTVQQARDGNEFGLPPDDPAIHPNSLPQMWESIRRVV